MEDQSNPIKIVLLNRTKSQSVQERNTLLTSGDKKPFVEQQEGMYGSSEKNGGIEIYTINLSSKKSKSAPNQNQYRLLSKKKRDNSKSFKKVYSLVFPCVITIMITIIIYMNDFVKV